MLSAEVIRKPAANINNMADKAQRKAASMNDNNLISLKDRTTSEQREIAHKGGKASGVARREKRDLRLALEILLEQEYTDDEGSTKHGAELLALSLFERALDGDTRAFEIVRDTAGQKPVEKIMAASIDPQIIDEVERMVLDDV